MRRGKAEEAAHLPLFIFLLVLIGSGLVGGWYAYFGPSPDGRIVYGMDLAAILTRCVERGLLDAPPSWPERCGLDASIIRAGYGFKLCLKDDDCFAGTGVLTEGSNFQACGLKGAQKNKDYPVCVMRDVSVGETEYQLIVLVKASARGGTA